MFDIKQQPASIQLQLVFSNIGDQLISIKQFKLVKQINKHYEPEDPNRHSHSTMGIVLLQAPRKPI